MTIDLEQLQHLNAGLLATDPASASAGQLRGLIALASQQRALAEQQRALAAQAEPVAVLRYERGTPGHENDMPRVISCNWMADGDYPVFIAQPASEQAEAPKSCGQCGGSGEVYSLDGEGPWRCYVCTQPTASNAGEPTREMISAAALFPIEQRLFTDRDGKTQVLGFAQAQALLRAALASNAGDRVDHTEHALEMVRQALTEFRQEDDYLVANDDEAIHTDTLKTIVRAALASKPAEPVAPPARESAKLVQRWMEMIDYAYQCRDDIRSSSGDTPRSQELRLLADEMSDALSTATPAPAWQTDIEAAAMKLAECMDYPWEHMTVQGRDGMRDHARAILRAARGDEVKP